MSIITEDIGGMLLRDAEFVPDPVIKRTVQLRQGQLHVFVDLDEKQEPVAVTVIKYPESWCGPGEVLLVARVTVDHKETVQICPPGFLICFWVWSIV